MADAVVLQQQQQRFAALAQANAVRSARRELKIALKERTVDPVTLIRDRPPVVAGVRVQAFLTWLPWFGPTRAKGLMHQYKIPNVELGKLGAATRASLIVAVDHAMARRRAA